MPYDLDLSQARNFLQASFRGVTSESLFSNKSFSMDQIRRSSGLSRLYDTRAKDDNDCRVSFPGDDTNSYYTKPRPPSSRITKRLSARGKHLLLKCTLRSAGASIFQRAPELFVFAASPSTGNERTWQALEERLIVPSSSRGRPRSATIAETELFSLVDLFSLSLFLS